MSFQKINMTLLVSLVLLSAGWASALDVIPPRASIKQDRPRLLLRPSNSSYGISLEELRGDTSHSEYTQMLDKLKQQKHAACQALVWQITGDKAAADTALAMIRRYRYSKPDDTFEVYGTLFEYGLAYDWLYNYEGFSLIDKVNARYYLGQLAQVDGLSYNQDHIFHNYIWMSACGTAIWALAVAGEDSKSDTLFDNVREWLNDRLYPGMQYLDGLPSESLGYWSLYDFTGSVWPVLAAQSAFEQDLTGKIRTEQGDWLRRHYENVINSVLPNMRYLPWGDVIGGPNGGVTHEMAGVLDALAWALDSGHGAYFSRWLAGKRGTGRFYGETSMFYMLYTRFIKAEPEEPQLSYLSGGSTQGGHFIARSAWNDSATVVGFGVKDLYGDHNHYDQGGFTIYRNGLLATDPTVYNQVNGPQQPTTVHSTLLIKGKEQEPRHGQDYETLERFKANLDQGQMLNTGDFLFYTESERWAAAAGQFAQAYIRGLAESCVRQLLFVRPGIVVVVDQVKAPEGAVLDSVTWQLELANEPKAAEGVISMSNGPSWLRCRSLTPQGTGPLVQATSVGTWRACYSYKAQKELTLIHLLEAGDGEAPSAGTAVETNLDIEKIELIINGWKYNFSRSGNFGVEALKENPGDVNGDSRVDIFDLLSLLKVLGGIETGQEKLKAADINEDSKADIFDLLELLKLLSGGSATVNSVYSVLN